MEHPKVVISDINSLSRNIWSLASKGFFDFMDIGSVVVCIWMIFWLICFKFVTDFIEILTYATFKYLNRFIWLFKLLQLDILLKRIHDFVETCELNYSTEVKTVSPNKETSENSLVTSVSVNNANVSSRERLPIPVLECTPCSLKSKLDINPRRIDFIEETRSRKNSPSSEKSTISEAKKHIFMYLENNSVSRPEKDTVFNTEKNATCSTTEYFDSNKNVISCPMQNTETRPTVNCDPDAVFAPPDQELGLKQKFFSWNINTIRDSFRKESKGKFIPDLSVRSKHSVEKVIQIHPTNLEDNERLIVTNDSPVNVGCCNSLFITFKNKLQVKENVPSSVHYKRF